MDVRFCDQNVDIGQGGGDLGDDPDRRAFAQVVDVGLERQAEEGDRRLDEPRGLRDHLLGYVQRLGVVDLTGGADQATTVRVRRQR